MVGCLKDRDIYLKSQNIEVLARGDENTCNLDYFGVLTDIIGLSYSSGNSVVLF